MEISYREYTRLTRSADSGVCKTINMVIKTRDGSIFLAKEIDNFGQTYKKVRYNGRVCDATDEKDYHDLSCRYDWLPNKKSEELFLKYQEDGYNSLSQKKKEGFKEQESQAKEEERKRNKWLAKERKRQEESYKLAQIHSKNSQQRKADLKRREEKCALASLTNILNDE
ncbi:hypothetical protein ACFL08_04045 [Patescibacteria group bacterium]